MRVLHIVPSLDPSVGGPARSVPDLCSALQRQGVAVSLTAFSSGRDLPSFPLHPLTPFPGTRQFPTPLVVQKLHPLIGRADIVHLHSLWNPLTSTSALLCRSLGRPYILTPMGMLQRPALQHHRFRKVLYARLVEQRTIQGAAALHFLSPQERHESEDRWCSFVLPSGVSPPSPGDMPEDSFRRRFRIPPHRRLVLFLGRLHWSKNLELQLEVLSRLRRDLPHLLWVFAGPDAGMRSTLERTVKERGLTEWVLFPGMLDHGQALQSVAEADLFVLTSHHEAHSMALNEALASGTPVVITHNVGRPEGDLEQAGRIVPPCPQALTQAVAEILLNPSLRVRLSAGARRLAARLSWDRIARRLAEIYELVLAGTRSVPRRGGA